MSRAGEAAKDPQGSASLPSCTVTVLFTDIEVSTKRWDRFGGAMRVGVERHDETLHHASSRTLSVVRRQGSRGSVKDLMRHQSQTSPTAAERAI
jgi:hypothetical protein